MRSDADKRNMAPLSVKLGDSEYSLPVLRIRKMREWRGGVCDALGPIFESFGIQMAEAGTEERRGGIAAQLLQAPEKVADLIFAYEPALPKDKILEEATEEQLVSAFLELMPVAWPFLGALAMMKAVVQNELLPYQPQPPTRVN